jgi:hypothetical protein
MHVVTKEWLHAHKTLRGGWTEKQLAVIGVNWPPPKDWQWWVAGMTISDERRAEFEVSAR